MHALAVINPDNGQRIPLISVLAPANHHDSHFMMPLINLGKAIDLRKNGERPFNLIKKREGLEYASVRGQHNILVQSILNSNRSIIHRKLNQTTWILTGFIRHIRSWVS